MNPWPFIVGAYSVTIAGTILLAAISYRDMRKAERAAEQLRREQ